ncbi:MAG: hypothetical protein ACKV2V_09945 [Blastocatellia bacterium]
MKPLIIGIFLTLVSALAYSGRFAVLGPPEASAQGRNPAAAKSKYGKFTHDSHAGDVRASGGKTIKLDCAYCHDVSKEKQDAGAYPNSRPGDNSTHSACTECHEFTGRQAVTSGVFPAMCVICHSGNETASARMKKNLRAFPNAGVELSQFGDLFSHKTHKDYLDKFNCSECHTANQQPVTMHGETFGKGVKMSQPGHPNCFSCHFDEKTIPKKSAVFALNCAGCHGDLTPAKGKPPEPAVNFFRRMVVEPQKPEKPFSHEDHSSDGAVKGVSINNGVKGKVSNQTKECMSCHLTGMTADKRSDMFADPKTKAAQPVINGCKDCQPVNGCLNCHQRYTSAKVDNPAKLEATKCTYCHSVGMMKAKTASGLPPASHLGAVTTAPAAPAPAAAPATPPKTEPKPEAKPATPAPKQEVKPTPAPAPKQAEMKPAPAPVKAEVKPAAPVAPPAAAKPDPKPETKPAPVVAPEPKPEVKPAPAAATPAPKPAAPASGAKQTLPGQLKLGDPKVSREWGLDAKWGLVEFDHNTHIKPTYAARCEICHHTNKDAKGETVAMCTSCHLATGAVKNPKSKGGDEVDVKLAYHGDPGNEQNNAGCIVCHQRYKENKPDANAPTKCAECHEQKNAFRWPFPQNRAVEQRALIAPAPVTQPIPPAPPGNGLSLSDYLSGASLLWLALFDVI